MIKLYGTLPSRMYRCLWMLEETGAPYQVVSTDFDAVRKPAYLDVNPNGRMPALRDGDLVLWESMAINLYLAEKYGGPLWPESIAARATTLKWTFWAVNEVEDHVVTMLTHRSGLPGPQRNESLALAAQESLRGPLGVLDAALGRSAFLVGPEFSAADINVASILSSLLLAKASLEQFPNVKRWLKESLLRPFPSTLFASLV